MMTRRPRQILSLLTVSASLACLSPLQAQAMPSTVRPGSVSPIINTRGTGSYSVLAVAAGWARTASISVSYTAYKSSSSNGPWSRVNSDSHLCYAPTSDCETRSTEGVYKGYIKVVASASGAGGPAENDPATIVKKVC